MFALGLAVTVGTGMSAIRTVILPRGAQSPVTRAVFRSARVVFRGISSLRPGFQWHDRVLAHYAPVSLILLVAVWLALMTVGFTAMFWAVEQQGWAEAFHTAGSSLLTLGFAPVEGSWPRAISFVEAALGLGLLALLITYLPTMYGSFSRRETLVGLLEARAGNPPSAVEMLERYQDLGWMDRLPDVWAEWEVWFAQIDESHISYPALTFFRSPQPDRHWVNAAGTVLDAASLTVSTLVGARRPQAILLLHSGAGTLRRLADFFGIPAAATGDEAVTISRIEYDVACERLEAAGLELVADKDEGWRAFVESRSTYDSVLLVLAQLTVAPYAPWVSDRSAPGYREPRLRRWGSRGR